MGPRFYALCRGLHLYAALFLSPFVLVFAASVFYLVHAPRPEPAATSAGRTVRDLPVPPEIGQLTGREQIDALRPILDRLPVKGEAGYIRKEKRRFFDEPAQRAPATIRLEVYFRCLRDA